MNGWLAITYTLYLIQDLLYKNPIGMIVTMALPPKTVEEKQLQPLYRRTYETILARIVAGELPAGAMLPSEHEIARELGVSQGTARKALVELDREGIVERRQGKGTFVAQTTSESALFHFFRIRDESGGQVTPELATETVRKLRSSAADRALFGDETDTVYEIRRTRSINGQLAVKERARLPGPLFPGLAERAPLPNTLYVLFQQAYGLAVVRAEEDLRPVPASAQDAEELNVSQGTPLLEAERRAIDLTGRVIEHRVSRYLLDGLRYNVSLN